LSEIAWMNGAPFRATPDISCSWCLAHVRVPEIDLALHDLVVSIQEQEQAKNEKGLFFAAWNSAD